MISFVRGNTSDYIKCNDTIFVNFNTRFLLNFNSKAMHDDNINIYNTMFNILLHTKNSEQGVISYQSYTYLDKEDSNTIDQLSVFVEKYLKKISYIISDAMTILMNVDCKYSPTIIHSESIFNNGYIVISNRGKDKIIHVLQNNSIWPYNSMNIIDYNNFLYSLQRCIDVVGHMNIDQFATKLYLDKKYEVVLEIQNSLKEL